MVGQTTRRTRGRADVSIANYGQLKTAVGSWVNRSNLTAKIPDFIALAEDRIARDTRIRPLDQETSAAITINAQTVSFATAGISDFLGARRFYQNNSSHPKLAYMPSEAFWETAGAWQTGTPQYFTIEGSGLSFAPAPDTTYTGRLLYWKRWAALSADADTNWLLQNHRELYLAGALIEAAVYRSDESAALRWAAVFDDAAEQLERATLAAKYPAGDLTVKSDVGAI